MQRTHVAVLGTLAEFHREPIPYDLKALVRFVTELHPDLLCLDMTVAQWERRDLGGLPPEYQNALLPLAHQTDIVVVPIAGDHPPTEPIVIGWQASAIQVLKGWLAYLYRTAPGPSAVNEGPRHFIADLLYAGIGWLTGNEMRSAWRAHIEHLEQQVLQTVQRDPDCRILVAVNVRYCHHIRHALKRYPEIQVVSYNEL